MNRFNSIISLLLISSLVLSEATASVQIFCEDSLYLVLKNKPIKDMTIGEVTYFTEMKKRCYEEMKANSEEMKADSIEKIEDIQRQKKVDKIVTPIVQTQVAVAVLLFAVTTFVFVMVMD